MRVFALSTLRQYWETRDSDAEKSFRAWFKECENADWNNFADVKQTFDQTDLAGNHYIFDVGGNKWRIIAKINFQFAGILIRWVGNHEEYSRLSEGDIRSL